MTQQEIEDFIQQNYCAHRPTAKAIAYWVHGQFHKIKFHNIILSDALKSPLDVYEVVRRDEYQALKDTAETLRQEIKEFYNVTAINEHNAPHDMLVTIVGVIRKSANEILARPNKPTSPTNSPPALPTD